MLEAGELQARRLEAALEEREGALATLQASEDSLARHCRAVQAEAATLAEERDRLHALLQQEEAAGDATETAAVWLDLGFTVMRSFPPVTAYGGPECGGSMHVQLSRGAAGAVAAVLNGSAAWAPLSGWPTGVPQAQTGWLGITMPAEGLLTGVEPSGAPGVGLFPWVWQVKEHHCSVRPSLAAVSTPPRTGPGAPALHLSLIHI